MDEHIKFSVRLMALFLLPYSVYAAPIFPGFDLFTTLPFTISLGPLGAVNLISNPIGPGNTDTIVLRKNGIDPFEPPAGTGIVDIELVALSLRSANSVDLTPVGGPPSADIYVIVNRMIEDIPAADGDGDGVCDAGESCRLASNLLAESQDSTLRSTGLMAIEHSLPNGGGFVVTGFNVTAEVYAFDPLTGMLLGTDTVNQDGTGNWLHTPLPLYPSNEPYFPAGDFFVQSIAHEGPHPVIPSTPEIDAASGTGALSLLAGGLALVGERRRRKAA